MTDNAGILTLLLNAVLGLCVTLCLVILRTLWAEIGKLREARGLHGNWLTDHEGYLVEQGKTPYNPPG